MMFSLFFFGYRPHEDSGKERLLLKGNCLGECQSDLAEVSARCAALAGKPTANPWGVQGSPAQGCRSGREHGGDTRNRFSNTEAAALRVIQ